MFLQPTLILLVRVEFVEDDVNRDPEMAATRLFVKPENSTRRRRSECAAMILPGATSSAADKVVCLVARSRGSGRSGCARSATSDSLAPARGPGSKVFRRHKERSPWRWIDMKPDHIGGLRRERTIVALAPRTCGRQGRYCALAGSARRTEHRYRPIPWPAADPSTERSPEVAAYSEAPECACS